MFKRAALPATAIVVTVVGLCPALLSSDGYAHHSPLTVYVMSERIEIEGTVTDYRFDNPHIRIFVDVAGEDGQVENWVAEGGTPNVLLRNGWSAVTFEPGDPIHISGNPARAADSLFIHMLDVRLPDGTSLYAEDIRDDAATERRRSRQR